MTPVSLRTVLDQLVAEQRIAPEMVATISATLTGDKQQPITPWYVRTLVGVCAWFAALCFVAFLVFSVSFDDEYGWIVLGLVLCVAASGIQRVAKHVVFPEQLALALSLAGQILFVAGIASLTDSEIVVALVLIVLEVVLFAVYVDYVHRFLATVTICAAIVLLLNGLGLTEAVHVLVALLALATVVLWEHTAKLTTMGWQGVYEPIGYALPAALFGLLLFSLGDLAELLPVRWWWLSALGLGIVLFYLAQRLRRHYTLTVHASLMVWLLFGMAILLLPALRSPGILAAVIVLLLGFSRGSRLLYGAATVFLAMFLGAWYYNLETTLLLKSLLLMATGVGLWVVRFGILRRWERPEVTP